MKDYEFEGKIACPKSKIKYIHFTKIYLPEKNIKEINIIRHDIKNKISPISGMIQLGNVKLASLLLTELTDYIDENLV